MYAEALVSVQQFDIVLDVLIVNRTDDTLQSLTLELATLGDLRLVERPAPIALAPRDVATIKASVKVASTDNGFIFGNFGSCFMHNVRVQYTVQYTVRVRYCTIQYGVQCTLDNDANTLEKLKHVPGLCSVRPARRSVRPRVRDALGRAHRHNGLPGAGRVHRGRVPEHVERVRVGEQDHDQQQLRRHRRAPAPSRARHQHALHHAAQGDIAYIASIAHTSLTTLGRVCYSWGRFDYTVTSTYGYILLDGWSIFASILIHSAFVYTSLYCYRYFVDTMCALVLYEV